MASAVPPSRPSSCQRAGGTAWGLACFLTFLCPISTLSSPSLTPSSPEPAGSDPWSSWNLSRIPLPPSVPRCPNMSQETGEDNRRPSPLTWFRAGIRRVLPAACPDGTQTAGGHSQQVAVEPEPTASLFTVRARV